MIIRDEHNEVESAVLSRVIERAYGNDYTGEIKWLFAGGGLRNGEPPLSIDRREARCLKDCLPSKDFSGYLIVRVHLGLANSWTIIPKSST